MNDIYDCVTSDDGVRGVTHDECVMAAAPSQRVINRALAAAQERAKEHTRKYGTPCEARVIRASNGEVSIVYDIKNKETGNTVTMRQIPVVPIT